MPISSDLSQLAIVAESTFATTPSTPAFEILPFSGESLKYAPRAVRSGLITGHRQTVDSVVTGAGVSGNVESELCYETSVQDLMAAALGGDWVGNVLKVGTTRKSFTIERKLEAGATDQYQRFTGCVPGGFSLKVATGGLATLSFPFLGADIATGTTIVSGATYTQPAGKPVIAAPQVMSVTVGGVSQSGKVIGSIDLNIASENRGVEGLGTLGLKDVTLGSFSVVCNWSVYFVDGTDITALKAQNATSLAFTLQDALGNGYTFSIPRLKFTDVDVNATGKNTDVVSALSAEGTYNAADLTSLIITRTPAP